MMLSKEIHCITLRKTESDPLHLSRNRCCVFVFFAPCVHRMFGNVTTKGRRNVWNRAFLDSWGLVVHLHHPNSSSLRLDLSFLNGNHINFLGFDLVSAPCFGFE